MIYEFEQLDTGERIEYPFLMSDAPSIGDVVDIPLPDGTTTLARRVASDVVCTGDPWQPYVSERLPRNLKDQPTDNQGRVIVKNREQEATICSRFGYTRD